MCPCSSKTPITNQECPAIIKMNGMINPDTIDWKMRGGRHSSDNGGEGWDLLQFGNNVRWITR